MKITQRLALLEILAGYKPTFETLEKAKEYVDFKKSLFVDEAEKLLIEFAQGADNRVAWNPEKDPDKVIESEHIALAIAEYKKRLDKEKKWTEKDAMRLEVLGDIGKAEATS